MKMERHRDLPRARAHTRNKGQRFSRNQEGSRQKGPRVPPRWEHACHAQGAARRPVCRASKQDRETAEQKAMGVGPVGSHRTLEGL